MRHTTSRYRSSAFDERVEETLKFGFWRDYQEVTGPEIDLPSEAEIYRYHRGLRGYAKLFDVDIDCHWGIPRKAPDSEPVLVYGTWNTHWKDLDMIVIPLSKVPAFTQKVRQVLAARAAAKAALRRKRLKTSRKAKTTTSVSRPK